MKTSTSFVTGLLAGAAVGAAIALLYAPQSGKETREKLKLKLKELEDQFEVLKGKAGEKTNQLKDDLAAKLAALQREIELLSKDV